MNDAVNPYWISEDRCCSINFSKVATTQYTPSISRDFEVLVPAIFRVDNLNLGGADALSAFAAFKKFHEIEP